MRPAVHVNENRGISLAFYPKSSFFEAAMHFQVQDTRDIYSRTALATIISPVMSSLFKYITSRVQRIYLSIYVLRDVSFAVQDTIVDSLSILKLKCHVLLSLLHRF